VAKKFFGEECMKDYSQGCAQGAIGKKIKIKGQSFEVIGIMKDRSSSISGGFDLNDYVYMPLKTAHKLIMGIDYVFEIGIRVQDTSYFSQARADLERLLRRNHNISDPTKDDFQIMTMEEALNTINDISVVINLLLGLLAAISLLVGGVGIMNIMLVSVSERTREIGLRKALGATKKNILIQFLIEAIIITGVGGVIGVVLGVIMAITAALIIKTQGLNWPLSISWIAIIVSFIISSLIGLVFGLSPARKAASLDPIRALRKE
jgi:putative ABC transport system permease protein